MEVVEGLHVVVLLHVSSSLDIESISLSWIQFFHSLDISKHFVNIAF